MANKPDPGPLVIRETDHPGQYVVENDHANHPGGPWEAIYVCFSGYYGAYGPHLFAAAPDLREALENLLAQVEQYGHEEEVRDARAALAKAKGEGA